MEITVVATADGQVNLPLIFSSQISNPFQFSPLQICPTCVKWKLNFDGKCYRFVDEDAKKKFEKQPGKYMPAMGGDCVVCFVLADGLRKPGIDYQFYKDRIFLFPSKKNETEKGAAGKIVQEFLDNKNKFFLADRIIHSAPDGSKGKQVFVALKNGFRHHFSDPQQFQNWTKANNAIDLTK